MNFKQGNKVEVWRTKENIASWFPGKIIYADESQYTVSYYSFLNPNGEPVVENVRREDVRPKPPPVKREDGWETGDIAEVFDLFSWKVGKVIKVLCNNRFVVRLFGSMQLKEFHESNLRVLQAWQNNERVAVLKDAGDGQNDNSILLNSSKLSRGLGRRSTQQCIQNAGVMDIGGRKRKAHAEIGKSDRLPMITLSSLKQVDAVSSTKAIVGKKCKVGYSDMDVEAEKTSEYNLHPFSMPDRVSEENNECSVASCGSNFLPDYNARNLQTSFKNVDDSSFDDAGSSCPSITEKKKYFHSGAEEELEADVHKLELHAYKSTVQAFYASGPLSWEQEYLLTNLRLSLHISNEEHLLQLRQLLSAQKQESFTRIG